MEDMEKKAGEGENEAPAKSKFSLWIENFFYHYKWHTLAVLFVILVIVVCSVQLCGRESYDALAIYAGGKQIGKTEQNGVVEYNTVNKAIKTEMRDFDQDGEITLGLETYFWLSSAEIEEVEANLQTGEEISYSTIASNKNSIDSALLYSDYFLWFISEDLYLEYYSEKEEDMRFASVAGICQNTDVEFYTHADGTLDTHAIKLSSTDLYTLPGMKDLPPDTLIAVRKLGAGANKSTKTAYENAVEIFKNIVD